ncbi:hypothetical protein THAOC_23550 [Thalassiosira oceanica]|uniref:Uncharacterized protein n=1 Tax=Thalassiosira oceanica TaxID=159749 RepID=K0RRT3_THAOC|nr:hypothetical protein THAOC_23550 [Thalassiosira oceanica]|eukprot:EJK56543.1 hypothetical protein THAOC_23550 [Thalassiosira oceanica]
MIYRHDGTIHPGPRTDYDAWTLIDDEVLAGTKEGCRHLYAGCTVAGRPFVDYSGLSLVAPLYVHERSLAVSWMGDASSGDGPLTFSTNSTPPSVGGDYYLVDEWTRRGLAEHASVASFAAFNVALMTNGAPSYLVEDALRAALDEVRHAKSSFNVVFKLSGKKAGPGSLPESSLKFTQDIKAMGMAVAREGCLDETLSAFDAKMESDHISKLLNGEVIESLYSSIDLDTLTWIRNELKTIESDESRHANLAWNTLKWLCGDNKDACEDIISDVFDKDRVEESIRGRATASLMDTSFALEYMRAEWNRVYAAFRADLSGCINGATPGNSSPNIIIDEAGQAGLMSPVWLNGQKRDQDACSGSWKWGELRGPGQESQPPTTSMGERRELRGRPRSAAEEFTLVRMQTTNRQFEPQTDKQPP